MKILRILNTNSILTKDSNEDEIVLLGAGLGFKKRPGDTVDEDKVEKRFILKDKKQQNRFEELVNSIPSEYILVAEQCISLAKNFYHMKLNESIHISLPDHIHNAISNLRDGFSIPNNLLFDIKQYYPKEFEIGLQGIKLILDNLHYELPEDEAGFIAMHFVNAQYGNETSNVKKIISIVREVNQFVQEELDIHPDENSLNYFRYMTHLKFFANRVADNLHYTDNDSSLYETLAATHVREFECSKKIAQYVKDNYNYTASNNEILYLAIHLAHITTY